MLKNRHAYIRIISSLKVSDDTAVEFVITTEWLPHSPDLNLLHHYVRREAVHVQKPERTVSALGGTVTEK
jgi:hypothetical protein